PSTHDRRGVDVIRRLEDVHRTESFALQAAQAAAKHVALAPDDVRPEVPVRTCRIPLETHAFGDVEDDRDGEDIVLFGKRHKLFSYLRRHVRRVDDGEPAGGEALSGDVVQYVECITGRRLVVLVVGDEAAAEVAADHLSRYEVACGEGRLAGA